MKSCKHVCDVCGRSLTDHYYELRFNEWRRHRIDTGMDKQWVRYKRRIEVCARCWPFVGEEGRK